MTSAELQTSVIDADAHVVENERVWDYLDASEKKFRPSLVNEPDNSWVPWIVHEAMRRSLGSKHPVSTDCLRRMNIYVSTQTDDDFAYIISCVGEDNLFIGTDYGHGDTSSELNAIARFKALEGLGSEVKRKILWDNPKNFYGI